MGFKIFAHSIRMVWSHIREALRISGAIYIVLVGLSVIAVALSPTSDPFSGWAGLAWFAAIFLVVAWIAVGWHRYILLDEITGSVLPRFLGKHILVYAGYGLLLLVITVGIIVAINLALTVVRVAGFPTLAVVVGVVLALLLLIALFVVPYRLAPLLPGSAIGRGLSIRAAWAATRGATGSIIILDIVSIIATVVIDLPAYALAKLPMGAILAAAWLAITGWLKLMIGITILTTIYGHYVEGRPIT